MSSVEIPVRVARIDAVSDHIKRVRLVRTDGLPLPPYSAGSHILVNMRVGSKAIKNPYSLMGPLHDTSCYEITVLRTVSSRGGSRFVHEHLRAGALISISPPVNLFSLDLRARKHLLVAGGIGITPIMAMAAQLSALGAPFELHYCTRTHTSGAYIDELKTTYGNRLYHYDSARTGRLDVARLLNQQPLGTHLYVCGPHAMITDVMRLATDAGWPTQHVHAEHFTAPIGGEPFEVKLRKSGRTIHVKQEESILQALENAGLEPPYLCRGGACGQCETSVVGHDGRIDHADHYLTDEEKQSGHKIMICVSRLKGSCITLDM